MMNERSAYEHRHWVWRIQPRNSFSDVCHKAHAADSYIADTDIPQMESRSCLNSIDLNLFGYLVL